MMCENTSGRFCLPGNILWAFCLQKGEDKQYTPSQSLLPLYFNLQNVKENGEERCRRYYNQKASEIMQGRKLTRKEELGAGDAGRKNAQQF